MVRNFAGLGIVFCVLASLGLASPSAAQTTPPSYVDAADCFFQDSLIGVFCPRTATVKLGVASEQQNYALAPIPSSRFRGSPTIQDSYKVNWSLPTVGLSVTPNDWLKLSAGASFADQEVTLSRWTSAGRLPRGISPGGLFISSARRDYWDWQTLQASAKIYDTGAGATRYLAHVYATALFVPRQSNLSAQSGAAIGANFAVRRQLSGSLSLYGETSLAMTRYFNLSQTVIEPAAKLLLARDDWGLAVGPETHAAILTARTAGLGPSPTAYFLGADLTAMPFKTTKTPILRDIVLSFNAEHSLGFAGPSLATGTTSSRWMNYTGTVGLNFSY